MLKVKICFCACVTKLSEGMSELSQIVHETNFIKMNQEQNTGIKQDQ